MCGETELPHGPGPKEEMPILPLPEVPGCWHEERGWAVCSVQCAVCSGQCVGGYPQQEHLQPMVPTWLYNDSLIPGNSPHRKPVVLSGSMIHINHILLLVKAEGYGGMICDCQNQIRSTVGYVCVCVAVAVSVCVCV